MAIDTSRLRPVSELNSQSSEESQLLLEMSREAREYLESHQWCRKTGLGYIGLGVGRVVAAFLFEVCIAGNQDELLWVIVGDLPSAYLVTDDAEDACTALEIYACLMDDWVDAVRRGAELDAVFPVGAPPDVSHAALLADRMRTLREDIIPACRSHRLIRRDGPSTSS